MKTKNYKHDEISFNQRYKDNPIRYISAVIPILNNVQEVA